MILNSSEIRTLAHANNFSYFNDKHVRNASYDLTTESIVDMDGCSHSFYKLPPQGMAYVIFKEKINLPTDIIAFAHVKTSITQRGIMATNIGIIDPGYEGYISTLLINFGSKTFSLSQGNPYLRLTFHKVNSNYKSEAISAITNEKYIIDRRSDTDNLDQKFLNLSSVSSEVFGRVVKYLIGLSIIFSAGSFAVAIYFQNKTSAEKDSERIEKKYEIQTSTLTEQNRLLQSKIDVLADSAKNMSKAIEDLKKKGKMTTLQFDNINEAQLYLIQHLLTDGDNVETRGYKTKEISPIFFSVSNPRKRITTLKSRNWNFATALGEFSWHLSMSNEVEFIATYLSGWKNYSEDKEHITGSCYGFKIFNKDQFGLSKWDNIINLLKNDPSSRRAVISLLDSSDQIDSLKLDISCTISLQFLIRNGKVDLIANMRSNDIIWGLPYDFFFFSYLQELMSMELNLPVGIYYHVAGSLHIYERHYNLGRKIIENDTEFYDIEMPAINRNEVEKFLFTEYRIRMTDSGLDIIENSGLDEYWKALLEVLYYYKALKIDGNERERHKIKARNSYSEIL